MILSRFKSRIPPTRVSIAGAVGWRPGRSVWLRSSECVSQQCAEETRYNTSGISAGNRSKSRSDSFMIIWKPQDSWHQLYCEMWVTSLLSWPLRTLGERGMTTTVRTLGCSESRRTPWGCRSSNDHGVGRTDITVFIRRVAIGADQILSSADSQELRPRNYR